jgi:hypothetical protein
MSSPQSGCNREQGASMLILTAPSTSLQPLVRLKRYTRIGNDAAYAPELFVVHIILNKRRKISYSRVERSSSSQLSEISYSRSREAVAVNFQTTCVAEFPKL